MSTPAIPLVKRRTAIWPAAALYVVSLAWFLDGDMRSILAAAGIMAWAGSEELVFRRWLAERLRQDYGLATACVASAVIFSLVHFKLSAFIFFGGLMLGLLYFAARSIVPGVLLHAAHNQFAHGIKEVMPESLALRILGSEFAHAWILVALLSAYILLTGYLVWMFSMHRSSAVSTTC